MSLVPLLLDTGRELAGCREGCMGGLLAPVHLLHPLGTPLVVCSTALVVGGHHLLVVGTTNSVVACTASRTGGTEASVQCLLGSIHRLHESPLDPPVVGLGLHHVSVLGLLVLDLGVVLLLAVHPLHVTVLPLHQVATSLVKLLQGCLHGCMGLLPAVLAWVLDQIHILLLGSLSVLLRDLSVVLGLG